MPSIFSSVREKLPLLEGEDPMLQEYNALRNTLSNKIAAFDDDAQKRFEENSTKLKAIIEKVKALDENEDFRELNKKVREFYQQWKEIVGENKFKYHDLWQEYKAATARFQEMQQWENWHNEKDRDDLLLEMDALNSLIRIPFRISTIAAITTTDAIMTLPFIDLKNATFSLFFSIYIFPSKKMKRL